MILSVDSNGGDMGSGQETIIFFDKLGFGWVLDPLMLKEMNLKTVNDEVITPSSLIKIIENILAKNPGA